MADLAVGVLAPVLAPVVKPGVKKVVAVIKRQFIYLCCFASNIAALRDEAQNLDDVAREVQARVNAAENDVQEIKPEIVTWLRDTNDIKEKTTRILNGVPNGCLARFSLSRSAVKTSEAMTMHREKRKLFGDDVFMAPSSAASKPTPLGIAYEFESRKKIEQDIMIALRGEEGNMIGICGMGGLGKTTMAKRIMNKVLEDGIFQEVVMAVVSQTVDELKIQVEIGGSLGLKELEKESQQARVQKLYERLTSSTKRTLLVLDDVWKIMKLKDLGIPCGGDSRGCRILITSRNDDVLKAMGVEKVFGLKVLSKEEAWFLFEKNVGTCVEDVELNPIGKQVVSECNGLPIAIEIVGAYLKDERIKSVWKDALKQLRKPNPKNTPDYIADVYKPLMVSYDKLDNDEVKSLFLLCCLFPEDGDIPLERLAAFCMGLRIFEDMRSVGDVRDRVCALVKRLKTRSLLLDSKIEDCVRMHDVVRDIGIFTRKQREKSGGNNGTWISSYEFPVGEETSEIPSLNVCLLLSTDDKIKIENTFFDGMRELYVLAIQYYTWTSLPQLPESLNTIRTLVLESCDDLQTISGVGGLVNLEILICRDCIEISELPREVGGLKHLKVLDLSRCYNVGNIAPGIISSLVELEELTMLESFEDWGADDGRDENRYARLGELESLTKLTCLEIGIKNRDLVSQQIKLSTNIKRFYIQFGDLLNPPYRVGCNKYLILNLEGVTRPAHWVEKLMKETECLCIEGNDNNNLDLALVNPNIRYLKLDRCKSMKNIMDGIGDDGRHTLLQHMEGLELSRLPQLQEIWTGPISSNSFQNIKTISLEDLPALEVMWRSTSAMDDDEGSCTLFPHIECLKFSSLPLLQEIWTGPISSNSFQNINTIILHDLPALEVMWRSTAMDDDDEGSCTLFPHIECLELSSLPLLQQVWNGPVPLNSFQNLKKIHINDLPAVKQLGKSNSTSVSLPRLQSLHIEGCGMMEQLFQTLSQEDENAAEIDQHYLHLFCQPQKISFGSLKKLVMDRNPFCRHIGDIHASSSFNQLEELRISKCDGSSSLFTPPIARNMTSLTTLHINDCDEMIRVIEVENEDDKAVSSGRLFPQLQRIELRNLSKLVTFGKWKCDADADELPPLKQLTVTRCPNMTLPLVPTLHSEYIRTDLDHYRLNYASHHQIPLFSFHGLRYLLIDKYRGGMCIFSSSIARNLDNLIKLHILICYEIVKVIEAEEEEEEERVASGSGDQSQRTTTVLFPNLQDLCLLGLVKLEKFGDWKHDVELPSLKKLEIFECPKMTKFTLGSITTPHLKDVRINGIDYNIDASTDLNGRLLQRYLTRQKESMEKDMWMEMKMEIDKWTEMETEMEEWMETK